MKKAQVKFGETIGIIIIVYIIVVLGFVWYNNSNSKAINDIFEEDQRERSFERYHFVMNLDLLHKSQRGFVDSEFDLNSLRSFTEFSKEEGREFVRSKLGDSKVTLNLYSLNRSLGDVSFDSIENLTLYNSTPDYEFQNEGFTSLIPVYDYATKKTYLGILEVTSFRRVS